MKSLKLVAVVFALALSMSASAQKEKSSRRFPITAEEGITAITASSNIDLLLVQSAEGSVEVRTKPGMSRKLKVELNGDQLTLSPAVPLAADERLEVFVEVSDLQSIRLLGNSFAVSRGVLRSDRLDVSVDDSSRVSIRTSGKIRVAQGSDVVVRERSSEAYRFPVR